MLDIVVILFVVFTGLVSLLLIVLHNRFRNSVDAMLFGGFAWVIALKIALLFACNYPFYLLHLTSFREGRSHIEPNSAQFALVLLLPIMLGVTIKALANGPMLIRKPGSLIFCLQIVGTLGYWAYTYFSTNYFCPIC